MKRIGTLLVTGLVLVTAPASGAQPDPADTNWYDIEVVVFRHLAETSGDAEWWPDDPGHPDVGEARALASFSLLDTAAGGAPDGPRRLSDNRLTLSGIVDALEKNEQYRPLLHIGWTQPAQSRKEAPLVRIGKGKMVRASETAEAAGSRPADAGQGAGSGSGNENRKAVETAFDRPPLRRPLDGTLRVAVNRYLHVWADLLFLPDDARQTRGADSGADTSSEKGRGFREDAVMDALLRGEVSAEEARMLMLKPEPARFLGYRLRQHRRMRSDELHYIDHPKLGIIVRATPREWNGAASD